MLMDPDQRRVDEDIFEVWILRQALENPTDDNPVRTEESVSFGLVSDHDDRLALDTGEVFQDYFVAKMHKEEKKLIYALITIRESLDDSYYKHNRMHYVQGTGPAFIQFSVFVEQTTFRELIRNVRTGLFPQTIVIEVADDKNANRKPPIEFGSDDSGLIWHNRERENKIIPIKAVRFDYGIVHSRYHEKEIDYLLPVQLNSLADRTDHTNQNIDWLLTQMLKFLALITMATVAVAIMVAILLIKRFW
jgi:hypothetical protein